MEIRRRDPRHPRSGPSCLLVITFIFAAFVGGYLLANRDVVMDAVLPDPTVTPTQSPASHATRAKLFERDEEYEQAVEAWRAAIDLDPENIGYYISLINLLVRTGVPEQALEFAEIAVEQAPENDEVWTAKAAAHLATGDMLTATGNSPGEHFGLVVEAGRSATTINPSNAHAYAYMSAGYTRQGLDFVPQASDLVRTALALEPNDARVLYHSADVQTYLGFYDTARDQLELAIANDPTFVDAYISLSRIYYFFNDERTRAIITLQEALDYDPTNAEVYDALAYFFMIAGDFPRAEENARLAIENNNDMVRAHARLGHAYYKQFNYPRAIEELNIAVEDYGTATPETAIYFAMLGLAYYFEDEANCPTAIPLLNEALTVSAQGSPAEISAAEGLRLCREFELNQP